MASTRLYSFKEGCLFQPVLLGIRDDIDADTTARLKYKPEEDGE